MTYSFGNKLYANNYVCVTKCKAVAGGLCILVVKHSMKYTNIMTVSLLMSYMSYISAGEVSEAYNYIIY